MLTLTLICVGRMKAGAERDLAARYIERAQIAGRALGLAVEVRDIPESTARRAQDRKREEADVIRAAAQAKSAQIIAFDETGRAATSPDLAAIVRRALDEGSGDLAFVIGGPDGLDESIRAATTHVIALGAMTWPHQLVRIMVAEQIYRAVTILAGHPYHRG